MTRRMSFAALLAARPEGMMGPILWRSDFAAFVKLARNGCHYDLASKDLTRHEKRHMAGLWGCYWEGERIARGSAHGKRGVELTVAGIRLFNLIEERAMIRAYEAEERALGAEEAALGAEEAAP